jgi:hypothetical protein
LGLETLSIEAVIEILEEKNDSTEKNTAKGKVVDSEMVKHFILEEITSLETLREILSGSYDSGELEKLLDDCDYLWAHFPESAGTEGRRPGTDNISFLKRVRAEIDPMLKRFNLSLRELP